MYSPSRFQTQSQYLNIVPMYVFCLKRLKSVKNYKKIKKKIQAIYVMTMCTYAILYSNKNNF